MIEALKKKNLKNRFGRNWGPFQVYRLLSFILIPLFVFYLILQESLLLEINVFHKSQVIYTVAMFSVFMVLSRVKLFKKNFVYAHYGFLFGIMLINIFWFYDSPGTAETAILILVANIIGICIVHRRVTLFFYVITLLSFFAIGIISDQLSPPIAISLLTTAIVITVFNYQRNSLAKSLMSSQETFKGIFDSSNHQVYVLSKKMIILDLSKASEEYLIHHDITDIISKEFKEVFVAETDECDQNFNHAVERCVKNGNASFDANCGIKGTNDFITKEFALTKGKYYEEEVFVLTVRIIKEQRDLERELIAHKENVTQILENINSFVFSISLDEKERFKYHVNFVSSSVEEVYGYSMNEYFSLVKDEQIDKDRHNGDKIRINESFERLLIEGGKDSWRFRMKVRGEWRWMEEKMFVKLSSDRVKSLFGVVKDVTDEIGAEWQLVESEKRYHQIFETNLAGVYKTNVNGDILDCNPAFAKILGFDSIEEVKKIKMEALYYDKGDRQDYLQELKTKMELNNYTSILKRKDGRRLIINNNVSLLPDENSEMMTIVGTVIDVTDLHETSLALKHSEEKYRLLFEESNNAILLLVLSGEDSFVMDANQMGVELLGQEENTLIGKRLSDLIDSSIDVKKEMAKVLSLLRADETAEKEWKFIRKDGGGFHAEVSFALIVLDEQNIAQLIIKDISERKQYEKKILESRLSFKNIVDRSPASILIFSNNDLAYVNPNGEDLFLNVLNSRDGNLFGIFPEDKHQLIKNLIKEAENNINSYTEIELGHGGKAKRYSINVVNTIYNFEKANLFLLQDITLQTEYNIQKLRAEMAEETNISLGEEIKRHKRTQRSLIESNSRLKALFESAEHLYIISVDRAFNLVSFNQNFKKMIEDFLGKEVEMGISFMDLFPIEDEARGKIVKRLNRVFAGNPSNLVSYFQSLKGEVWMESFMCPILIDGQETNEISFISHNITEQIENRKRILASEENNKALLLAVPDILFKANGAGFFTDYRPSSESDEKAFRQFVKTDLIKGQKIRDVMVDAKVAKEIKQHVQLALKEDKLVTHNFSVNFGESRNPTKVHYENRYSKINEDEVMIISRNVTSTIEYEEKLLESVKEKEVLLKEVHHRVKNNLQVINSILNLQSSYVKDDETLQIIIESQNRIRSMSYIHESLYQTKDFSSINFRDYITNLIQNLVHSYEVYSDKTELDLQVTEVELALDQAIPCGLILNELITNALKYAYPIDQEGKITIEVFEKLGKVHFRVQDFGRGLPEGFKIGETDSLGLSLVDTLIDQLDGELILRTERGTEFLIIFEKQEI